MPPIAALVPVEPTAIKLVTDTSNDLPALLRAWLIAQPPARLPATYQAAATALNLTPPNTIRQIAEALEHLMAEDAQADRPFIAALIVSKGRPALPRPGFFERARELGKYDGPDTGVEAEAFHAAQMVAVMRLISEV